MQHLVIIRKHNVARDIVELELGREDGQPLAGFEAGAHIDLHLPSGTVRQYSLTNPGAEPLLYRVAVLKDPNSRGGSREVHEVLQEGQCLPVSAARNLFPLHEGPQHSLLLAGGIGITPILAMARQLLQQGRSFSLHYACRSRDRAAFLEELQQGDLAPFCHVWIDDEGQRLELDRVLVDSPVDSHLYVCGPSGFIDAVLAAARAQVWAEDHLHREFFTAPVVDTAGDNPFELQLNSGQLIQVAAEQTALEALLAAGVDVPSSCEQGICGACLTNVVDGQPDHRDQYLTSAEQASNRLFTPCCSRSFSARLVIDL